MQLTWRKCNVSSCSPNFPLVSKTDKSFAGMMAQMGGGLGGLGGLGGGMPNMNDMLKMMGMGGAGR